MVRVIKKIPFFSFGLAALLIAFSVSKGFVDYFNSQGPAAGIDENRTLFHVL